MLLVCDNISAQQGTTTSKPTVRVIERSYPTSAKSSGESSIDLQARSHSSGTFYQRFSHNLFRIIPSDHWQRLQRSIGHFAST